MKIWFTKIAMAVVDDVLNQYGHKDFDWGDLPLSGDPDLFSHKWRARRSIIPQIIRELSDTMEVPPEPEDLWVEDQGVEGRLTIRELNTLPGPDGLMNIVAEAFVGSVEVTGVDYK